MWSVLKARMRLRINEINHYGDLKDLLSQELDNLDAEFLDHFIGQGPGIVKLCNCLEDIAQILTIKQ